MERRPEIAWYSTKAGRPHLPSRRMHNIYPLCQVALETGLLAEHVQVGWLGSQEEEL